MTEESRQFETLIARVEGALAAKGAVIRSPDRIPDKITGQLREVDASIRHQIGSVPVLITIKCRKRAEVQDSTWIEQLITKKRDIGASHTIAIASAGLSRPALEKAAAHGIDVRRITEITDEEISSWLGRVRILSTAGTYKGLDLRIDLHHEGGGAKPGLVDDSIRRYRTERLKAAIFTHRASGSRWSILDFLRHIALVGQQGKRANPFAETIRVPPGAAFSIHHDPAGISLFEDVPVDGGVVRKTRWFEFPPGQFCVETTQGLIDVKKVEVDLDLSLKREQVLASRSFVYTDAKEPIAAFAETEVLFGEAGSESRVTVSCHHKLREEGASQ